MFDPPITTIGTITDCPKPKIYQIKLPNGKTIIGHVSKALAGLHDQLKIDDQVQLELTPYDFTKGRITAIINEE